MAPKHGWPSGDPTGHRESWRTQDANVRTRAMSKAAAKRARRKARRVAEGRNV